MADSSVAVTAGAGTLIDTFTTPGEEAYHWYDVTMPKRTPDDTAAAIASRYARGERTSDLAREYGVSRQTVINCLYRQKVESRGQGVTSLAQRQEVAALYRSGWTQQRIADHMGLSRRCIIHIHRGQGVVTRTYRGPTTVQWKGGRHLTNDGYVRLWMDPNDPFYSAMATKDGYVLEHRLLIARSIDRPLYRSESVHHINGDRSDNRIENLQLRSGKHGNGVVLRCDACGSKSISAVALDG